MMTKYTAIIVGESNSLDEHVAPTMLLGGGMMVGAALLATRDQERPVAASRSPLCVCIRVCFTRLS